MIIEQHDHKHGVKPHSVLVIYDGSTRYETNVIGRYDITNGKFLFVKDGNRALCEKAAAYAARQNYWNEFVY